MHYKYLSEYFNKQIKKNTIICIINIQVNILMKKSKIYNKKYLIKILLSFTFS